MFQSPVSSWCRAAFCWELAPTNIFVLIDRTADYCSHLSEMVKYKMILIRIEVKTKGGRLYLFECLSPTTCYYSKNDPQNFWGWKFGKIKITNEINRLLWNFLSSQLPPFSIFGQEGEAPAAGGKKFLHIWDQLMEYYHPVYLISLQPCPPKLKHSQKGFSISLFLCPFFTFDRWSFWAILSNAYELRDTPSN